MSTLFVSKITAVTVVAANTIIAMDIVLAIVIKVIKMFTVT